MTTSTVVVSVSTSVLPLSLSFLTSSLASCRTRPGEPSGRGKLRLLRSRSRSEGITGSVATSRLAIGGGFWSVISGEASRVSIGGGVDSDGGGTVCGCCSPSELTLEISMSNQSPPANIDSAGDDGGCAPNSFSYGPKMASIACTFNSSSACGCGACSGAS